MSEKTLTIEPTEISDVANRQLAKLATRVDRQNEALQDKDDIIGALTDRLEQAAEQLDRLKRSGADRGPRGVPNEMFAAQESMRVGIESIADQFEGIDLGASFYRLELLMNEVRELVIHAPTSDVSDSSTPQIESSSTNIGNAQPESVKDESASEDSLAVSDWDAIKRQLLGDEAEADEVTHEDEFEKCEDAQSSNKPLDSALQLAAVEGLPSDDAEELPSDAAVVSLEPLPDDLPEPVDLEFAEPEDLIDALEVRDRYISVLTRRLEDRHSKLTVPTDWDVLAQAPDSLVAAVHRLHDELTDAVRTAEVDICLERARLSRERTKLDKLSESIEESREQADQSPKDSRPKDQSQRWRRMLGISENDVSD